MGRRRKSSTSTIAAVEKSHFPKEGSVMKPCPHGLPDNDWPILVLKDAVIYERDGKTLGNPLLVDRVGPMLVRGRIDPTDEDGADENGVRSVQFFLKHSMKSTDIEIPESWKYAIGDGEVTLWISGIAGWYEIRPAPEYEAKYLEVCEAIALYYEALYSEEKYLEACTSSKKKFRTKPNLPPPLTIEDIFFRYAIRAGDGATRDEVETRYRKWAPFFAIHFPREQSWDWERTAFAKWIHQINSEAKGATAAALPLSGPHGDTIDDESKSHGDRSSERPGTNPARLARGGSSQNVEMTGATSTPVQHLAIRKGTRKVPIETPVPLPPKYRLATATKATTPQVPTPDISFTQGPDSPVDQLLNIVQEIVADRDPKSVKVTTIHTQMYLRCKIRDYKTPKEITAYYAPQLLSRLGPEWSNSHFYNWLFANSKNPPLPETITVAQIPSQLHHRAKAAPRAAPIRSAPNSVPAQASKAKGRAKQRQPEDDSDSDVVPPGKRARRSGKGAGLRLLSGSKKRPALELDLDGSEGGSRGSKKLAYTADDYDDDDEAFETSNADSADSEDEDGGKCAFPVSPPKDSVQLVVHAERIPTMSPTGPNGTWICEEEGCSYVIRSADGTKGQSLVQEHFRQHEAQAEKISLAVKESRGQMPINHLLDKIQALGQRVLGKQRSSADGEPLAVSPKRSMFF